MALPSHREVARLPRADADWVVGLVRPPEYSREVEGYLIIADIASETVRLIESLPHGASTWPALARAASRPAHDLSPACPRLLRCSDPALAERLRRDIGALDLPVEVSRDFVKPFVEGLERTLRQPDPAPGLEEDHALWATQLRLLCGVKPWREVSEGTTFRFDGIPGLEGRVAILLGGGEGLSLGVALFSSEEDYRRYRSRDGGRASMRGTTIYFVRMDPEEDLEPSERRACRATGLALPGGLMPWVGAQRSGRFTSLAPSEQRRLLAAVEAIALLCVVERGELERSPTSRRVRTVLGEGGIRSTPPRDEVFLLAEETCLDVEHSTSVTRFDDPGGGGSLPCVILIVDAEGAERITAELGELDRVRVELLGEGMWSISGWRDEAPLGLLTYAVIADDVAALIEERGSLLLAVSAQGPGATLQTREELDASFEVCVESVARVGQLGDRSREGGLEQELSEGRRPELPRVSDALLEVVSSAFGEPLPGADRTGHLTYLHFALLVWNAVVAADHLGEPRSLQLLRANSEEDSGAFRSLLDDLVRAKRRLHPDDDRVITEVNLVSRSDGFAVVARSAEPWATRR